MRRSLAVLILLLSAACAWADATITGPAEFREHTLAVYEVPEGGELAVKTPDGLSVHKHGNHWIVTGKPGEYRLEGFWVDFEARKIEVVDFRFRITRGGPGPEPGPEPGPGPDPEPDPADPLTEAIRAAYVADLDSRKAADLKSLEAVYRNTKPASYRTAGELFAAMRAEAQRAGVTGKLRGVQVVIQTELIRYLPTDPAASYDPAMVGGLFGHIADALKEAGK